MSDKLAGLDSLDKLAKALESRSKKRDNDLQTAVDSKLVQPGIDGTTGQILSIDDKGDTKWIDNSTPITEEMLEGMINDVFKDEIEVEDEIVEVNSIKVITEEQIDNIIGSVF